MNPKTISLALIALLLVLPVAFADGDMDAIMEPINKIYDLIKNMISVVAILAITFAGIKYMFSGDNVAAREGAKSMLTYAVIGIVVIWVAPPLVNYIMV